MANETQVETCVCSFGAGILSHHLRAFQIEIDGVRNGNDIEFIHRMRVATRRLRSALPLFAFCFPQKKVSKWLKQIKLITSAMGAARDTDVQIDLLQRVAAEASEKRFLPGLKRLHLRLSQSRMLMQNDIHLALNKIIDSGILVEMDAALQPLIKHNQTGVPYPHTLYRLSAEIIQQRLTKMLSYEAYIHQPECVNELHAMRIATKWLRYTLETFAALYSNQLKNHLAAVKQAQEVLGSIHDCDVWEIYIPQFVEEERKRIVDFYGHTNPLNPLLPGLQYFRQNRLEKRQVEYSLFLNDWHKWQKKAIWPELERIIEQPLVITENMYPPLGNIGLPETSEGLDSFAG